MTTRMELPIREASETAGQTNRQQQQQHRDLVVRDERAAQAATEPSSKASKMAKKNAKARERKRARESEVVGGTPQGVEKKKKKKKRKKSAPGLAALYRDERQSSTALSRVASKALEEAEKEEKSKSS